MGRRDLCVSTYCVYAAEAYCADMNAVSPEMPTYVVGSVVQRPALSACCCVIPDDFKIIEV